MAITALVFDMDGLMLDTEPIYRHAWQCAGGELGYTLDDEFYETLVGRPNPDCEAILVRKFGAGFPLEAFRARWPMLWRSRADAHGINTKPGLLELLAFAEKNNLRVAVATSSDAEYTKFTLGRAGLDDRFEVLVTGDEVQRGKPNPDIYLEAARRLAVEPEQCVALEDSEAGIIAASSAGMVALMVPDLIEPSAAARRAAFRVLTSLLEAPEVVATLSSDLLLG